MRTLQAERRAVKAQRRAVRAELEDISKRLRAARKVVADLGATGQPDDPVELSPERRAARDEVRRLHRLRIEARQRMKGLTTRARTLREESIRQPWDRARETAVAEGVADYFPSFDEVEGDWLPGYARKPSYLVSRREFVRECRQIGGLRRTDRVLDVGCGIGGVAMYLIGEVGDEGSYAGLDVEERAIDWCRQHIGAGHPNFSFEVMDVFSSKYNPQGRYQPQEYRFPYEDGSFDFVIMRSLFTHMLPPDVDHYLAEVARLLAPGGRSAITYFLLDEATEAVLAAGTATRTYPYRYDNYRLDDEDVVEAAVAIDETWVRDAYARHGIEITSVAQGTWRTGTVDPDQRGSSPEAGRFESVQDTVYATRR